MVLKRYSYLKYGIGVFAIILLDQAVKLYVHAHMVIGTEIPLIGDWLKIHYTINPGMAFGIQFGAVYGKFLLTFFRIIAIGAIGWYCWRLIKRGGNSWGLLWGLILVLGGAIGNVIDSIFYGALLNNAPYDAPMAWGYGQVIDMFYIDIWEGFLPHWVPFIGGNHIALWPIFNIADMVICIGIGLLLITQKRHATNEETAPS